MPRGNSWTLLSLEVFLVKTTPSNETRMLYSQALPSFSLKNLVPSNWSSGMMHLVPYCSSYKWPISLFFSAGFMSLFSCCLVLQFLYLPLFPRHFPSLRRAQRRKFLWLAFQKCGAKSFRLKATFWCLFLKTSGLWNYFLFWHK